MHLRALEAFCSIPGGLALASLLLLATPGSARASDALSIHGYADFRLVFPSDETTWLEGGLGKLRYGSTEDPDAGLHLAEIVAEANWQVTPELNAFAAVRHAENQRSPVDLMEAYLRYRPVSTDSLRWSVKVGAFYPPVSLENDEIGWTSEWSLTPSVINTWIGEEIRTIGAEAKIELRGTIDTIDFVGSIYGWNDPAGVLIADRGWAMHDRPTSLFDRPRYPDVFAAVYLGNSRANTAMFKEIDDRAGWYVGSSWTNANIGKLAVLWYDNEADPAALRGQYGWRTRFLSLSYDTEIEGITVKAQAMSGDTVIAPRIEIAPGLEYESADTDFSSAFLLLGYAWDDWRLGFRTEIFRTRQMAILKAGGLPMYAPGDEDERGHANTLAVSWTPHDWLRLTAEGIMLHSVRGQRSLAGLDPTSDETEVQFSARFFY